MFFVASKVFWGLAQPLSLSLLLLLVAVALFWWRRRRSGLAVAAAGLAVLGLSSFTSLGFAVIGPLEARFERPAEMPAEVGTIVMLGGATVSRVSTTRGVPEMNEAGDRLSETLRLAQLYPEARILLSGGVGLMVPDSEPEAVTAQRFLQQLGIAPERLILEGDSRNTDENAALSRELLADRPGAVVLVTSAFHMPRSVGLFRKQGIEVIAWPTDYRSTGEEGLGVDVVNPVYNLETTTAAVREWIGLVAYRMTGRIDDILPAQTSY